MLAQSLVVAVLATVGCGGVPADAPPEQRDWDAQRRTMVEQQVRQRGSAQERVLEAMRRVPRHRFVPECVRWQS